MKECSDIHATQMKLGANTNTSHILCCSILQAGDRSPHGVTAKALPAGLSCWGSAWGIKLLSNLIFLRPLDKYHMCYSLNGKELVGGVTQKLREWWGQSKQVGFGSDDCTVSILLDSSSGIFKHNQMPGSGDTHQGPRSSFFTYIPFPSFFFFFFPFIFISWRLITL